MIRSQRTHVSRGQAMALQQAIQLTLFGSPEPFLIQVDTPCLKSHYETETVVLPELLVREFETTGVTSSVFNQHNARFVPDMFTHRGEIGRIREQTVIRDNYKPHSSGDVQLEFTPDSANRVSLSVNGWLGNWPDNRDQHTQRFSTDGVMLENYRQQVTTQAPNRGVDLNLSYTHSFHKPGQELYLMARHSNSVGNYSYDAW